jgi:hypothetical protein
VIDLWRRYGKIVLLVLGVGLLAYSIHTAGPRSLLAVAQDGLAFLPFIALCCGTFYFFEGYAQRAMLGAESGKIPPSVFIRATLSAYVASTLLPLGRAGSEVARIAAYAPWVGAARASAASATFQVANLSSTGIYGLACYAVVGGSQGFGSLIAWVLLLHAVGSCLLASLVLIVMRRGAPGRRLARVFPSLMVGAETFDQATALGFGTFLRAIGFCMTGRVAEVAEYAFVLMAVGLEPSVEGSFIAAAIHAVGASLGEAIPGQIGAVEGAFIYFAEALGLQGERGRAIAMPLLVRVAQFGLAACALVLLHFTRLATVAGTQPKSS